MNFLGSAPRMGDTVVAKIRSTYHFTLALAAALWYGFPSRNMTVIGVTGTKGKTSTVELLHEILTVGGYQTASSSSLCFQIGDEIKLNDLKMTMPGRFFLQRFLYEAKKAGCRYVVLEVTSQGIMQHRHRFIRFDTALLTNIAPEHIEAHRGFENYVAEKRKLFRAVPASGAVILNRDDAQSPAFAADASARTKIWYGRGSVELPDRRLIVKSVSYAAAGISFVIDGVCFRSSLQGEFNLSNILAALAAGMRYQVSLKDMARAVKRVSGITGRMEYVQRQPFAVIADYAHTPDSQRAVYETLQHDYQRLICVFGATGGGRDMWKRPEFAKIAERFCETVVLTNEDPYDEDPEKILDQIQEGFSDGFMPCVVRILDRKAAIREAVSRAREGDAVIITGKGGEPWMMGPAGTKIPWDDRQIAREALAQHHFYTSSQAAF